jgi:erythronate-4-phosphate dehydrogenase
VIKPKILVDATLLDGFSKLSQNFDWVAYPPVSQDTRPNFAQVGEWQKCQGLIIRSSTKPDPSYLKDSDIVWVGSCTSGMNHVDLGALAQLGIHVQDAKGSNAPAVADYIFSVLALALKKKYPTQPFHLSLQKQRVGIVGMGCVGLLLAQRLVCLGVTVLAYDPFVLHDPLGVKCSNWLDILACDVISFHVPLTTTGPFSTLNWLNLEKIAVLNPEAILINAARGEVFQTDLYQQLPPSIWLALDTWHQEPHISEAWLARANIATPHVSGYSALSKHRAIEVVFESLLAFFKINNPKMTIADQLKLPLITVGCSDPFYEFCMSVYNPLVDDLGLRSNPKAFAQIRANYFWRSEWSQFRLAGINEDHLQSDWHYLLVAAMQSML